MHRSLVAFVALLMTLLPAGPAARGADATFEHDVEPILTRAGCNAGACHGKSGGQNGFALSLLGFDRDFDFKALARDTGGRRVSRLEPGRSLLLLKATAEVPHGGGRRFEPGGAFHDVLRRWIVAGMPRTPGDAAKLEGIEVAPTERTVARDESFPLRVTARYDDGSRLDVTHLAAFASSESTLVAVDADGRVKAGRFPGEATLSARFEGSFANCDVSIPLPGDVPAGLYENLPRANFIDGLTWAKLRKLGLTPSARSADATFLRRAHLDVIGRLPTPDEARAFLADSSADKRARLVDRLLDRPEYADHWANKWMDLLRPNPYRVGIKAVLNLDGWIRDVFRSNLPYDEFARRVVTAKGSTFDPGAATIFRDRREPQEIAPMLSQLFLGVRLDCAKCHHHPFEPIGQEQFYEFAAYFRPGGS